MQYVADLHTHSLASGHAYSTMEEVALAAHEKGFELIALTDHGPSMPGGPHIFYFYGLHMMPKVIHGVRVLKGVEVDILNEKGELDLSDDVLGELDYVIASFHSPTYKGKKLDDYTDCISRVMENPLVDTIGHPGNPQFPLDYKAFVDKAVQTGTLVEINNHSFDARKGSYDNCLNIAKLAAKAGTPIVLASDAHVSYAVGEFSTAHEVLKIAGVSEQQILNTSVQKVLDFLRNKGKIV